MIGVISATRLPEDEFWKSAALGISLRRISHDTRIASQVACSNKQGLPDIYNPIIASANPSDLLVFVHDDIWFDDYHLADRVIDGLSRYDVIGVAGNRRQVDGQPAWAFLNKDFAWDTPENLSGSIAQGKTPFGRIKLFGAAPADCESLDGCFIAARAGALQQAQVRFDPRFDFHMYDMDFCRSARKAGLKLGTWPIAMTHQSDGMYGTPQWIEKYEAYLAKWGK